MAACVTFLSNMLQRGDMTLFLESQPSDFLVSVWPSPYSDEVLVGLSKIVTYHTNIRTDTVVVKENLEAKGVTAWGIILRALKHEASATEWAKKLASSLHRYIQDRSLKLKLLLGVVVDYDGKQTYPFKMMFAGNQKYILILTEMKSTWMDFHKRKLIMCITCMKRLLRN